MAESISTESNFMTEWDRRSRERHAEQVAKGLHDDECEYGPRLAKSWHDPEREVVTNMHMCHCAKRAREAKGETTVPGALHYSNPSCPRCWDEVDHDGDVFVCHTCNVKWDPSDPDDDGEFTDDYGDLGRPVADGEVRA